MDFDGTRPKSGTISSDTRPGPSKDFVSVQRPSPGGGGVGQDTGVGGAGPQPRTAAAAAARPAGGDARPSGGEGGPDAAQRHQGDPGSPSRKKFKGGGQPGASASASVSDDGGALRGAAGRQTAPPGRTGGTGPAPGHQPPSGDPEEASTKSKLEFAINDPQAVLEHTVICTFSGRIKYLQRGELMDALTPLGLVPADILAMGPVGNGSNWHLVLSNAAARNAVLVTDHLPLRGGQVRFSSRGKTLAKVRVHWLPLYVPEVNIISMLSQWGVVKENFFEKSIVPGMTEVHTLVRSYVVLLEGGVQKDDLPFLESVSFCGETFEYMVTVQGRQPRCLRCKQIGHIIPDCKKHFCKHCNCWCDHTSVQCNLKGAYSNIARRSVVSQSARPADVAVQFEDAEPEQQGSNAPRPSKPAPAVPHQSAQPKQTTLTGPIRTSMAKLSIKPVPSAPPPTASEEAFPTLADAAKVASRAGGKPVKVKAGKPSAPIVVQDDPFSSSSFSDSEPEIIPDTQPSVSSQSPEVPPKVPEKRCLSGDDSTQGPHSDGFVEPRRRRARHHSRGSVRSHSRSRSRSGTSPEQSPRPRRSGGGGHSFPSDVAAAAGMSTNNKFDTLAVEADAVDESVSSQSQLLLH